jgi:ATP-dependent Clp protease ATP-binding subunit ClpX
VTSVDHATRQTNAVRSTAIQEAINRKVVGQAAAKRDLATLLAMHLQWFAHPDPEHTAPNALVIGPTGVGKTHAIRTAADSLNIPLVIVDSTRLSPHGYQGTSLEDVLVELISATRRLIREGRAQELVHALNLPELDELKIASRGVVFLDEFDKLSTRNKHTGERNELLQRRLLQFVDGTIVSLNPNPEHGEEEIQFDTGGLLFVAAGAFTNLLDDAAKRSQEQMREMLRHDHVIFEDLVRFGFMKELIARLPVVIEFVELTVEDLERILHTEAVDPSLFYSRYLASLGTRMTITPEAKCYIAERAAKIGIGARGLHQVLFPMLALASQDLEEEQLTEYVLTDDDAKSLERRVEERRNVR